MLIRRVAGRRRPARRAGAWPAWRGSRRSGRSPSLIVVWGAARSTGSACTCDALTASNASACRNWLYATDSIARYLQQSNSGH
jgi:hypothetical protein